MFPPVLIEEQLEDWLASNLGVLRRWGWDLELRQRQTVCQGAGGRIDLLCYDRRRRRYVVIELKNVRAGRNTFGQISSYMGWVQGQLAKDAPVYGLVISRGCDVSFEAALGTNDRVRYVDVGQLGFQ